MGKFVVEYPQLAVEFISTVDGDDNIDDLTSGSGVKAVWRCPDTDHTYETSVRRRVYGASCPYCSGRKVLAGFNDVATTHPHVVEEWVDVVYTPQELSAGSNKPVAWECEQKHQYVMSVKEKLKTKTCPECSGRTQPKNKRSRKMGTQTTETVATIMKERTELFRPENKDIETINSFHEWVKTRFAGKYYTPETKNLGKPYDYYFPETETIIIIHKIFYPKLVGLQTVNYVQQKHEWFTRCGYTVLPLWEDQILHHLEKTQNILTNHVIKHVYNKDNYKVKISNTVEAETFHQENNLNSFIEAERHYIVYNVNTGETEAMFSTNVEDIKTEEGDYFKADIVNFTAKNNHVKHFTELTSYVSSLWGNNVEYVIVLPETQKYYLTGATFEHVDTVEQKWVLTSDTLTRETTTEPYGNYTENLHTYRKAPISNIDVNNITHY